MSPPSDPQPSRVTKQAPEIENTALPARIRYDDTVVELPTQGPFTIGTASDNDLVLSDEYSSRHHAQVQQIDGRWYALDLDSTNGTFVNRLRITRVELPEHANLRIGSAELRFEKEIRDSDNEALPIAGLIGRSPPMRKLFAQIRRVASRHAPVLICGPSGTGKELVARAVHDCSPQRASNYLPINCAALSPALIDAELFGYTRGAFTGAERDKPGAFESVGDGTLFLDEIAELPMECQPKLLRVLESKVIRRIGGVKEIPVHARLVAATHADLAALVKARKFREDLFHRLFVLPVEVPPLGARGDDIIELAEHFRAAICPDRPFTAAAEARLKAYHWPGNVRELRNTIERSAGLTEGKVLTADDLILLSAQTQTQPQPPQLGTDRDALITLLERTGGNQAEVARILGVPRSTLNDKVRRMGIERN